LAPIRQHWSCRSSKKSSCGHFLQFCVSMCAPMHAKKWQRQKYAAPRHSPTSFSEWMDGWMDLWNSIDRCRVNSRVFERGKSWIYPNTPTFTTSHVETTDCARPCNGSTHVYTHKVQKNRNASDILENRPQHSSILAAASGVVLRLQRRRRRRPP